MKYIYLPCTIWNQSIEFGRGANLAGADLVGDNLDGANMTCYLLILDIR